MKSFMKWGMSIVLVTLAIPALAYEEAADKPGDLVQIAGLSSARAACYIDTTAWDVATPDYCSTVVWGAYKALAVFSVIGIDQASGRYQITYLGNTCTQIWSTTQEGLLCSRSIGPFRDFTQRVQVTDLYTGQSVTLQAVANWENGQ
jgi:hypothetical protein